MGLKCRLLGHQYGDPEIEREREENGDEVVVTIREIQVCQRCEDEHVVSENKEVTSIRDPQDVGLDEAAESEAADPVTATESSAGPETTDNTGTSASSAGTPASGAGVSANSAGASANGSEMPADNAGAPANGSGGPANDTGTPADDAGTHIAEAEPDDATVSSPVEDADGPEAAEASGDTSSESSFNDDDFEPPESPDEDDAVILDDEATERDETQWPEEAGPDPEMAARESAAIENDEPVEADDPAPENVTDDAEFIDADEEEISESSPDRGHGEWPEREDVADENTTWPVQDGEDEGFAAEPSDGVPADVSFGGLTPESNGQAADSDADEEEYITAGDTDGFTRAEQQDELQSDVPDDRIEFYCPNCGHARTAGASSMRAGDICPECKQGYIAERKL
ncbi:hypothetical protein ELS19_01530 [Halogeometricum borinquense]|uniref:Uncharacterized protein n=1 Tax=Halogeometricum borinquense TaxID=60847 RepID=A0A482TLA9_9EURY|nr:hypothetical protein [Halogeometricum borinquense]RYJ12779.1 hypothetical protein ELS19_01530 [Halogeometricum borinquense]